MSMIMAVAPDLVHRDRLPDGHGLALGPTGLIYTPRSFTDLTTSGVAGDARTASANKGAALLTAYAQGIAALQHDQPSAAAATPPIASTVPEDRTDQAPGQLPPVSAAEAARR